MNADKTELSSLRKEAAVCGLFCTSCSIYIGTKEDPERLAAMAKTFNVPVKEMECKGCRSNKRIAYCSNCKMFECASEKGIDFCGECEEYPCEEIKQFQSVLPHRVELWKAQERIKEAGSEIWYSEMLEHYGCPQCGTVNSAYDMECRKCGTEPGSRYVEENREEIIKRMENLESMI